MKVLRISGDDYGALSFINNHGGKRVDEVINNLEKFQPTDEQIKDCEYWDLSVHEFKGDIKDIDPEFLQWIRNQIDYDTTKHEYYYFEGETIE